MAEIVKPRYPYPIHINLSNFVTIKLTETNFLLWQTQFLRFIRSQDLLGFIDGSIEAPPSTLPSTDETKAGDILNPEYQSWYRTDQLISSWISGSVSEDVLGLIIGLETSTAVWSTLCNKFTQRSVAKEFELRSKLQSCQKRTRLLSEYLREFKLVCDQLNAIGKPVDEITKVFGVLEGLGSEYEAFKTTIYCLKPQPRYEDVIAQLEQYETRHQNYHSSYTNPNLAFAGETFHQNGTPNPSFLPSGASGPRPFHRGFTGRSNRFGMRGRNSSFCGRPFSQYGTSRPAGSNSSDGSYQTQSPYINPGFRPYTNTQHKPTDSQIYSPLPTTPSSAAPNQPDNTKLQCQICKRPGHDALRCWYRFDNSYQTETIPHALTALHLEDDHGGDWFPDSGATAHITSSTGNLHHFAPYYVTDTVMVGNGVCLPITHIGTTSLIINQHSFPLKDVLVVPQIKRNLLSVSKLTADYPCSLIFADHGVYVKDYQSTATILLGTQCRGLYKARPVHTEALFSPRQQTASSELWHLRLGHTNYDLVKYLAAHNKIRSIAVTRQICSSCQVGKSSRLPFTLSESTASCPLEKVCCDVWGPAPVASCQQFRFYVAFIDSFSRFTWVYPMKKKSDFLSIFLQFQALVENQFSCSLKTFQCDGGGEFSSNQFLTHLTNKGIKLQVSCPYTPEQNGTAERKHRHIVELGLSMLYHAHMPLTYWVDAFLTATFLINLLPSPVLNMQCPFEKLFTKSPTYGFLRTFGCACYPYLRPYSSTKFDPRSLRCVFVGYSTKHKGYRCLHPSTGRVYVSRHVIFDESQFPFSILPSCHPLPSTTLYRSWLQDTAQSLPSPPTPLLSSSSPSFLFDQPPSSPSVPISVESPAPTSSPPAALPSPISSSPAPSTSSHPMHTRLRSGIRKPNPKYALAATHDIPQEPTTVTRALLHPGWHQAMLDELDALKINNTWELVPRTSAMNIVGCKWVFKTKLNAAGHLDKLKARLVAKGFHQEAGVDYTETFSPVVRQATVRLVLSVALINRWPIHQLDVKNAFLHGSLQETVFMEQPPGFINPVAPHHVCLLRKALYGLKQAPRAWFEKFSDFLLEKGFHCSSTDPSLFILHLHQHTLVLLLYVDDIILTGSSPSLLHGFITDLSTQFSMKDLGQLHYFLGVEARFHGSDLFLTQSKYAGDLLKRANMEDCNPVATPLPLKTYPTAQDLHPFPDVHTFRSLAGGLQYLTLTRPDIAYSINFLCQRMHSPTNGDFKILKRILRYIKGTQHLGLSLHSQSSLHLYGYADSDWAGCSQTRRSTTGFCLFLGSNLISWSAKRQHTVSRSSTEAEYRALASASADLTWASFVLRDLGIPLPRPSVLYCDNQSAISLTANPVLHARTKHVEIDFHFVREKVALRALAVLYIPAYHQLADIFTKALSRFDHSRLRSKLGLSLLSTPSLRGANEQKQQQLGLNQLQQSTIINHTKESTVASHTTTSPVPHLTASAYTATFGNKGTPQQHRTASDSLD